MNRPSGLKVQDVATPMVKAPPPAASPMGGRGGETPGSTIPGDIDSDADIPGADVPSVEAPTPKSPKEIQTKPVQSGIQQVVRTPSLATSADGTLGVQPVAEPFDDGLSWDDIPDLMDDLAPKPVLGQPHLTPEAIRSRSRRIFTKRGDGTKKVSDEIWNDWHSKGSKKKLLEDIFKQCGYDPDLWL